MTFCVYQFDPLKWNAFEGGADKKLGDEIYDAAIEFGFELARKGSHNANVKSYKCSIDFHCCQYFKTDLQS